VGSEINSLRKGEKTMTTSISLFNNRVPNLIGRTVWDDIFHSFFNEPEALVKRSTEGYPVTDIYRDTDSNQVIELALAGFHRDDLSIEIKENQITVSAVKKNDTAESNRRIARRSFKKTFVDYSNKLSLADSDATFEDGLLMITVPPVIEAQPVIIEIK
tara:strand:+ start:2728 stop:3204 length:477 start_codon:yes stop_codon:yes gene_type:complete